MDGFIQDRNAGRMVENSDGRQASMFKSNVADEAVD
jgi:hypothetical protein